MVVLSHHAPLLAVLQGGKVVAGNQPFSITGGIARVKDDEILIMTDE